jgi:hypothetical protein
VNTLIYLVCAVAVFVCVLAAVLWLWDTYQVGRAVAGDSDTDTL